MILNQEVKIFSKSRCTCDLNVAVSVHRLKITIIYGNLDKSNTKLTNRWKIPKDL